MSAPAPTARTACATRWPTTPTPVPGRACTSRGGSPASVVGALPARRRLHATRLNLLRMPAISRTCPLQSTARAFLHWETGPGHLTSMGFGNGLFATFPLISQQDTVRGGGRGLAHPQDGLATLAFSRRANRTPLPGGLEPRCQCQAERSRGYCHLVLASCTARR